MSTGPPSKSIEQKRVKADPEIKKSRPTIWKRGDKNTEEMYRNRELSEENEQKEQQYNIDTSEEENNCQLITDGYVNKEPDECAKMDLVQMRSKPKGRAGKKGKKKNTTKEKEESVPSVDKELDNEE